MPGSTEGGPEGPQSGEPEQQEKLPPNPSEQAIAKALLEKEPKTGAEHLANIEKMQETLKANMEGMEAKGLKTSPQYDQLKNIAPALATAADQQAQINTMFASAGVSAAVMGAALVLPGMGVVFTPGSPLMEKLNGEGEPTSGEEGKPMSFEDFQKAFEKIAGSIGELKEAASKAYRNLRSKLAENLNSVSDRCNDAIRREKTTMKNRREDRASSGPIGWINRNIITGQDTYQIDINAAKQKVYLLTNMARPRIREAIALFNAAPASVDDIDPNNPPDFAKIKEQMNTCYKMVRSNSRVDTDNERYELQQKSIDVTEAAAWASIEAFAAVASLGVGSAVVSGGKAVGQGVKHGYNAYKVAYPYVLGAGIATGIAAEGFREKEGEQSEAEKADEGITGKIVEMMNANPKVQESLISGKFMDQIPVGEHYVYSTDLQTIALNSTLGIVETFKKYKNANSVEEREEIMRVATAQIDKASGEVLDQFLKDNLDPDGHEDYVAAKEERELNDPYHIQALAGSMQVMERVASGDMDGATAIAKTYVQDKMLGLQPENTMDPSTVALVNDMANKLVMATATQTYPLFVAGLQKYSKTGFTDSFMSRVNSTKDFIGDAVTAPFDDAAYGRIAGTAVPAWEIISAQGSEYADLIPLIMATSKAAGIAISDHVDMADLLATLGGSFAFDAVMLGGAMGLKAGGKAMLEGGKASKVSGRLAIAASYAPAVIDKSKKAYAAKGLTLAELNAKISSTLG